MSLNEFLIALNMRGINQIRMRNTFEYTFKNNELLPAECEVLKRMIAGTIELPTYQQRFLWDRCYVIDISNVTTLEPISVTINNNTITDSNLTANLMYMAGKWSRNSIFSLHYKNSTLMTAYFDDLFDLKNYQPL